jgi:hypothetical protein
MVAPGLLAVGAMGFVTAVRMSRSAYENRQPAPVRAGLLPRPGAGDVPAWISALYLLSASAAVVGQVMALVR